LCIRPPREFVLLDILVALDGLGGAFPRQDGTAKVMLAPISRRAA
jgi:hypothetical protein